MTDFARAMMDATGTFLDLVAAPFTLPGSRLLVTAGPVGLTVSAAEYERDLDECALLDRLQVLDGEGAVLGVSRVLPDRIEFGGLASLTFAGANALSIGRIPHGEAAGEWSVTFRMISASGTHLGNRWAPELPSANTVGWFVGGGRQVLGDDPASSVVRLAMGEADACVLLGVQPGSDVPPLSTDHAEHTAATFRLWSDWFATCPRVRDDLQAMAAFCWWVLGANIIELPGLGGARVVVPSKIGYVGLWQWDAYFIAVGLRHGAPELAREQLELALRFPSADGQLPDVVHDFGVLASSDDLPPADRDSLRRAASSAVDAVVPLTKPPLAAWALRKVLDAGGGTDEAWALGLLPVIERSQLWWFDHSDLDADGMPEYGHPYSSGLDDSPIFDGALPVDSPDLAAYLVLQDRELALLRERFDDPQTAAGHRLRAESTLALLLERWDAVAGRFEARAAGVRLDCYAVVSLLPLVTGSLPAPVAERIVAALADDAEFAAPYPVPTVARGDPSFSAERMWRGPVWVNVNTLLVEGLRSSGFAAEALELAERTVALVRDAGGPHEYFNPLTGTRAPTATTSFGWSAALFIELAVQLSAGENTG